MGEETKVLNEINSKIIEHLNKLLFRKKCNCDSKYIEKIRKDKSTAGIFFRKRIIMTSFKI
jgi:hypothetical protein